MITAQDAVDFLGDDNLSSQNILPSIVNSIWTGSYFLKVTLLCIVFTLILLIPLLLTTLVRNMHDRDRLKSICNKETSTNIKYFASLP